MNSLSFIHSGSSANVMVFLATGLEKDTLGSESSSARRERGTCRWRRGAEKVMMEVEREGRKAQTEIPQIYCCQSGNYYDRKETTSGCFGSKPGRHWPASPAEFLSF